MSRAAFAIFAATCGLSCAGPAVKPHLVPAERHRDALLILPGLGYGRDDGRAFQEIAASAAADGIDVYVPSYLTRTGLDATRDKLRGFIRAQRLDRYERLHVFAFLAGGWAFNSLVESESLPNLATVVYDRSPLQERAPAIAAQSLPVFAWLRYGSTIFDLAHVPYPPLTAPGVRVALLIETRPTDFIRHHDEQVRESGPLTFACDALGQRYDACAHVPLNHDELYTRFGDVWPEVRAFITTGSLSR